MRAVRGVGVATAVVEALAGDGSTAWVAEGAEGSRWLGGRVAGEERNASSFAKTVRRVSRTITWRYPRWAARRCTRCDWRCSDLKRAESANVTDAIGVI